MREEEVHLLNVSRTATLAKLGVVQFFFVALEPVVENGKDEQGEQALSDGNSVCCDLGVRCIRGCGWGLAILVAAVKNPIQTRQHHQRQDG